MQDIEPYFKWRDQYIASEDKYSPFFGRHYNEFQYSNTIYNFYIHPQWDTIDSETLYLKILFVDYTDQFAIIELIGEWNDAIQNDIMYLKRQVIEKLMEHDINRFILILDNVLNFHGSDDCYYEEWYEEISEEGGWIVMLGVMDHIEDELKQTGLQYYIHFGDVFNDIEWRRLDPSSLYFAINQAMHRQTKRLRN
jgi:hypothetical protein